MAEKGLRIAFFETKEWDRKYMKKRFSKYDIEFFDSPLDISNADKAKAFDVVSVFIYSKIDSDVLKKLPNLKMIATRSTGFDHIDIKACAKRGIAVCNVPSYGDNTVAEHTFGLILSLSRNIHKSYVKTLKDDFSTEGFTGFDLRGKTIGVIGGGHIGMHVVKIAKGFGMDVIVFDLRRDEFLSEVLGFRYEEMNKLVSESDIVSLHLPLNTHTHHLIDKKMLMKFKKGSILINTARGGVVDTDALLWALDKGILGGAGLDVIEGEELLKEEKQFLYQDSNADKWRMIVRDHKIFQKDNVVFTPHNAFNSQEALFRILDTTMENIDVFMQEGKPLNAVK